MSGALSLLPLTPYRGQYIPPVSSPLLFSSFCPSQSSLAGRDGSPSSTRLCFTPMLPSTSASNTIENRKKRKPFSERVARVNPLIHNRDDRRETRQNLFLRKVKDGSEETRWKARGGDDEIMRTLWLAEENRRIEQLTREASSVPDFFDEELEMFDRPQRSSSARSKDEEIADQVAQQEDAELEALVSLMDDQVKYQSCPLLEISDSTTYECDGEEYDLLFMSVIGEESDREMPSDRPRDMETVDEEMVDVS